MLEKSSVGSVESRQARLDGSSALAEHSTTGSPWIDYAAFLPDIATLHLTIADLFDAASRPGTSELWLRAALGRTVDGPAATRLAALLERRGLAKEAVAWYRRAAELGDLTATARLAVFCELKDDREMAKVLLALARSHMTPEQLLQADKLAVTLSHAARQHRAKLISDCADEDLLFWVGGALLVSDRRDVAGECYSAVAMPGRGHSVAALSLSDLRALADLRTLADLRVFTTPGAGEVTNAAENSLEELVSAAAGGAQGAIAGLLSRIRPLVVRYCRSRVSDWGTTSVSAEDVAQDACLAVFTA
ncbi:MAG: hypothetical protein ACRDS0_32660, partial [Pseudonocardiaceae bacterium]